MGGCGSTSPTVFVTYSGKSIKFEPKSIIELRLQIIKHFSLSNTFFLLVNGQIIKSTSDLLMQSKNRIVYVDVLITLEKLRPHKSQIEVSKRNCIMYLSKYIIFPIDLFDETTIHKHNIIIGNELYELKSYYHALDIPGLALGKIRKQKRKIECLTITDEATELDDNLFVYKNDRKYAANIITASKSMIAALVYNKLNIPVAVIAWNEKNLIIPIVSLKNSVQFAINFANLPNESLPLNISNLNTSDVHQIYTEYSCYFSDGKIYTYHPNEYSVDNYTVEKNFDKYSITQTPIGFIIHYMKEVFAFNTNSLKNLPQCLYNYNLHSALLHQASYVVIGGSLTTTVESLHLYTLNWNNLPSLPQVIESATACSFASSIYVLGGCTDNEPLDTVFKLDNMWEKIKWKLPWTAVGPGVITIGQEIVVFGGKQNDKDKYVVLENGKEIAQGALGIYASFEGMQCGRVNFDVIICSRQGQIFKYDTNLKRFFICSIGNYFNAINCQ